MVNDLPLITCVSNFGLSVGERIVKALISMLRDGKFEQMVGMSLIIYCNVEVEDVVWPLRTNAE